MFKHFSNMKSKMKLISNATNSTNQTSNSSNPMEDGFSQSFESYETFSSTPNKTRHIKFGKESEQKSGEQPKVQVFHESDDGKGGKLEPEDEAEELKRFFPKKSTKHHKRRRKFLSLFDDE